MHHRVAKQRADSPSFRAARGRLVKQSLASTGVIVHELCASNREQVAPLLTANFASGGQFESLDRSKVEEMLGGVGPRYGPDVGRGASRA